MKNLFPPIFDICHCGCGQIIYGNNGYIKGHNRRNKYHSVETKRKISSGNKGKIRSDEAKKKNSDTHKGKHHSEEHKRKISESAMGKNKGKIRSDETKKKLSEANKGINNPNYGKPRSDEIKKKISNSQIGKIISEESKRKNAIMHKGKTLSKETRIKLRQYSGERASNWQGGISYLPYCPKFNKDKREEIRNEYDRKCFICNKDEKDNVTKTNKKIRKLCIHHVDLDKGQGCNGKKWKLVPLCGSCHSKLHRNKFSIIIKGDK